MYIYSYLHSGTPQPRREHADIDVEQFELMAESVYGGDIESIRTNHEPPATSTTTQRTQTCKATETPSPVRLTSTIHTQMNQGEHCHFYFADQDTGLQHCACCTTMPCTSHIYPALNPGLQCQQHYRSFAFLDRSAALRRLYCSPAAHSSFHWCRSCCPVHLLCTPNLLSMYTDQPYTSNPPTFILTFYKAAHCPQCRRTLQAKIIQPGKVA